MILLYIYAGVSLLTFTVFALITINGTYILKQRYPDLHIPKSHWSKKVMVLFEAIIMSMLPIFNILLLLYLVFKSDEVTEAAIHKTYMEFLSEENK